MILELDCGNSLIKWRVIDSQDLKSVAAGVAESDEALLQQLQSWPGLALRRGRMVSVRSEQETLALVGSLGRGFGINVRVAESAEELAGVRNGYRDVQRLGLDRWLALVAGYRIAGGACLVLDLGTAVTSDLVDSSGQHLGGYICPGVPLMRSQLRTHTRRIRYDDATAREAAQELAPGRDTAEAVERGCLLMLRGFVREQYLLARDLLGGECAVFLTGGDAELVRDELPQAQVLSELVFAGLAIACPLE